MYYSSRYKCSRYSDAFPNFYWPDILHWWRAVCVTVLYFEDTLSQFLADFVNQNKTDWNPRWFLMYDIMLIMISIQDADTPEGLPVFEGVTNPDGSDYVGTR